MDAAPQRVAVGKEDDHAPLVDVTGLSMGDILRDSSPALARSVRRLVRGLDDPNGVISAFSSFVS